MTAATAVVAPLVCRDVPFTALAQGQNALLLARAKSFLPHFILNVSVHAPKGGAFLSRDDE